MGHAIRERVTRHPRVESIVELFTRHIGAFEVMLAERVEVVEGLFSAEIEEMSCEIDADRRSG